MQGLEGLVRLVGAVEQIQALQREVDDEGVEQELADGVETVHVHFVLAEPGGEHVDQHHRRDARDDGGEQEHDGHHGCGPPGVRLQGTEDEADIPVEQEGRRDADDGEDPPQFLIELHGFLGDAVHVQGEDSVHRALHTGAFAHGEHNLLAVIQPDLQQ